MDTQNPVTPEQREEWRWRLRMHERPFSVHIAAEELSRCGVLRQSLHRIAAAELRSLHREGVIEHVGGGWFRWIR